MATRRDKPLVVLYVVLARCYVITKIYKELYDTVLLFTIMQSLRARANIYTVLAGQHVYCIRGNNIVIVQSLSLYAV